MTMLLSDKTLMIIPLFPSVLLLIFLIYNLLKSIKNKYKTNETISLIILVYVTPMLTLLILLFSYIIIINNQDNLEFAKTCVYIIMTPGLAIILIYIGISFLLFKFNIFPKIIIKITGILFLFLGIKFIYDFIFNIVKGNI